jgi:Rod binding domain-containing protein
MDFIALAALDQKTPAQRDRAKAEKTAAQFEQLFVRSMVSSLRSTASLGGDDSGMFGSGPGADTFGDWFDQNLAEQISRNAKVGISEQLLVDLERNHEIPAHAAEKAKQAQALADRGAFMATTTLGKGGFDVVL